MYDFFFRREAVLALKTIELSSAYSWTGQNGSYSVVIIVYDDNL